ncbi:MAG: glycogen/starch synthase, partial [Lentisphaerota bacterium]
MKILYVASEILPFASTGGLAELGSALPKALIQRGIAFVRIMPLYRQVAEGGFDLKDTGVRLDIPVGFRVHRAEIWVTNEPEPMTYFIRKDEFFDRSQLYSLPERDYDDNFERYVFFQKAVVALIDAMGLRPDIVHCSDWQAGLIPLFLRHGIQGMGRNQTERTVFTIHNLAYQGIFPGSQYSITNLPFFCFSVDVLEYYGNVNCLKAGVTAATAVTTVSKTYAQEIKTEEYGWGLQGVLTTIGDRLTGIAYGADYNLWDPSRDPFLLKPFSEQKLDGKMACKKDLADVMGIDVDPQAPLIGMVSRLINQKGLDILAEAMPRIMEMNVRFALLGVGQE